MSCDQCEIAQHANAPVAYYRWKNANIAMQGCVSHLRQIFDVLSHIQTTAADRDRLKESNEQLLEACQELVGLVKMVEADIVKALAEDYRHYVKEYLEHAEAAIAAAQKHG